jgi:hypothetical protein
MSSIEEKVPSDEAVGLSATLLAAAACFAGVAATQDRGATAVLLSPLFVGALVGAYSYRRPVRAALVTVALATIVIILAFGEPSIWIFYLFVVFTLWALPAAILGAICGSTVRRRVRRVTP